MLLHSILSALASQGQLRIPHVPRRRSALSFAVPYALARSKAAVRDKMPVPSQRCGLGQESTQYYVGALVH